MELKSLACSSLLGGLLRSSHIKPTVTLSFPHSRPLHRRLFAGRGSISCSQNVAQICLSSGLIGLLSHLGFQLLSGFIEAAIQQLNRKVEHPKHLLDLADCRRRPQFSIDFDGNCSLSYEGLRAHRYASRPQSASPCLPPMRFGHPSSSRASWHPPGAGLLKLANGARTLICWTRCSFSSSVILLPKPRLASAASFCCFWRISLALRS